MTGVTDLPFRRIAARLGAAYVATEMVATEAFLAQKPEAVRRAAVGEGLGLMVVQLLGADPAMVRAAAAAAARAGADIIDLNFGCPAKSVTGQACGAAIMRDLDLARALIDAALEGSQRPVSVKMRLGWDAGARNAAELARRAEAAGASALTVHGRTRAQFYDGAADWAAVREVVEAVGLPVAVNGDVLDAASARRALALSGAQAVMIGRGALGRPWIAAVLDAALAGTKRSEPEAETRLAIVRDHIHDSLAFYGERLGLRMFRKHLAAYVEQAPWPGNAAVQRQARARLCRLESSEAVIAGLADLWSPQAERLAA